MSAALFKSDLWTSEPPEGGMFIWAYRKDDGRFATGLGYWTVTAGQWRCAHEWNADHHKLATMFHPMPDPSVAAFNSGERK